MRKLIAIMLFVTFSLFGAEPDLSNLTENEELIGNVLVHYYSFETIQDKREYKKLLLNTFLDSENISQKKAIIEIFRDIFMFENMSIFDALRCLGVYDEKVIEEYKEQQFIIYCVQNNLVIH